MQLAICHYSLHRRWNAEKWDALRLAQEVKRLGVAAIDFHAGLLGSVDGAPEAILGALEKTGLTLSGLSLSTNFNQEDAQAFRKQIDSASAWLEIAGAVKAPVSRVFGGHVPDRKNKEVVKKGLERVVKALKELAPAARDQGVALGLENHGGLPCSGEEQVAVIEAVGSPALRATIDMGNYMQCGQEAVAGTRVAAKYAAYVHVKDFVKKPTTETPWGWTIEACTIGRGNVDLSGCLDALRSAGYDGFLALEYEGPEDETIGVPQSLKHILEVMRRL